MGDARWTERLQVPVVRLPACASKVAHQAAHLPAPRGGHGEPDREVHRVREDGPSGGCSGEVGGFEERVEMEKGSWTCDRYGQVGLPPYLEPLRGDDEARSGEGR